MATDKRLDQVSTLTDFDYALIVKGDQVAKASKQQLAELVGNLLYGATNASSLATVVEEQIGINYTWFKFRNNFSDANKEISSGCYLGLTPTALINTPLQDYSILVCFNGGNTYIIQIFVAMNGAKFYKRASPDGGLTWSTWASF